MKMPQQKLLEAELAKKAWNDHLASLELERQKTAKLRGLRLASEKTIPASAESE